MGRNGPRSRASRRSRSPRVLISTFAHGARHTARRSRRVHPRRPVGPPSHSFVGRRADWRRSDWLPRSSHTTRSPPARSRARIAPVRLATTGPSADRTKRTRVGTVSPSSSAASRATMAGTAFTHVTFIRSTTSPRSPGDGIASSRPSVAPATELRQQPDHFRVDVPEGKRVETPLAGFEPVVQRDGPGDVQELIDTEGHHLGSAGRAR